MKKIILSLFLFCFLSACKKQKPQILLMNNPIILNTKTLSLISLLPL